MKDSTIVCCSHCGKDHSIFETQFEGCCSVECLSLLCTKEERKRIIAKLRKAAGRPNDDELIYLALHKVADELEAECE